MNNTDTGKSLSPITIPASRGSTILINTPNEESDGLHLQCAIS